MRISLKETVFQAEFCNILHIRKLIIAFFNFTSMQRINTHVKSANLQSILYTQDFLSV